MAVDAKHPEYVKYAPDWEIMRDTYAGERHVKEESTKYLPATSGMYADGMAHGQTGWNAYQAYLTRAVFHEFVSAAVEGLMGVLHRKPAEIKLPPKLEPMRNAATIHGEGLQQLIERITENQMVEGRIGLFVDLPSVASNETTVPYFATYAAPTIINWDYGGIGELTKRKLNLVVLNETSYVRSADFQWTEKRRFRVLSLGDLLDNELTGDYKQFIYEGDATSGQEITPVFKGRKLDEIPFVFINSKDVVPDPDDPPMIGLAQLSLAIYRGEADYRQSLFMQGQDTLVATGLQNDVDVRVGANSVLKLPIGGDAKYIGVSSDGLAEQRQALENDKRLASLKGGQMIDTTSRQRESGDALKVRVAAQTANLNQIGITSAHGLENALKIAARWVGADDGQVEVHSNLDFVDAKMTGKELRDLMDGRNAGAPMSLQTIHNNMREQGLTDLTFEEELERIQEEMTSADVPLGTDAGGDPDPVADDTEEPVTQE